VRGLRLVPAGEEAVDGADAALGRHDERRPALAGRDRAVVARRRLERADHGRADGDHPASARVRRVDEPRRGGGDAVPLGAGRLALLERRDAGVEDDRGDGDAARDEGCDDPLAERTPGARHLGAPGLGGVDRLVGVERPLAVDVAIPDRPAVTGEVRLERRRHAQLRDPEPRPGQIGGDERRDAAARQREPLARPPRAERGAVLAELDEPVVGVGQRRGDVEVELGAVGAARAERRGHGRRRVDDEEVARHEHVRQVAGTEVAHPPGRPLGHEHPHLVALEPARLGRLVGLEALGEDERLQRAHRERSGRGSTRDHGRAMTRCHAPTAGAIRLAW